MGEVIKFENTDIASKESEGIIIRNEQTLLSKAGEILSDIHEDISHSTAMTMPIAQLSTLGAGVASLIPAFNTVTATTTFPTGGFYRIANAAFGDALKANKTGEFFWGALKTADGSSKMAQLVEAGNITGTTETVAAINPATVMMAVALFSIEQKLGDMAEMERQILTFLENEKESEIEADVQTLGKIISDYKHNWDNEHYIASNHKLVLDIQRTARKNMISYQKEVAEAVSEKKLIIAQSKINAAKESLIKKFKYYRLSMFTFSMSSLIEIMLSGNFKEEYISGVKSELEKFSLEYRELFENSSVYLEKLSRIAIEQNVLKGVGIASDAVGKFIGKIPVVERGPVDEFLQDSGAKIQKNAAKMESDAVVSFATVSNPGIRVFIDKMDDMIQIYNHTTEICFDQKQVYLIAG